MLQFATSPYLLIALITPYCYCIPTSRLIIPREERIATDQGKYVGYVGDPDGRGTLSLVISCLLTLILCVWSALHLNIPEKSQTFWGRFYTNSLWIATGICAPELVVFTAWRQWSSARILAQIVKDADEAKLGKAVTRRHPWTMTHSFFACTGGFAIEILDEEKESDTFLPSYTKRLTLTARGMAVLARCGHLPDISEADIADKSKANDVAKALVILQASWMLVQVFGRLAASLPVTLLEVNTIAHVLCAFLMCTMWWYKPLSPREPLMLTGSWVKPLVAYMYMSSEMSGEMNSQSVESETKFKTLLATLRLYSKIPEIESMSFSPYISQDCTPGGPSLNDSIITRATDNISLDGQGSHTCTAYALQPSSTTCLVERLTRRETVKGTAFFERLPRVKQTHDSTKNPSCAALNRWYLATTAIQEYVHIKEQHISHSHPTDHGDCKHFRSQELVADCVQNWPRDDLLRSVNGLIVGMILWLACLAYGSIHLTAWNDHFPTVTEKWLWRASSLYIGFCGGLWIILNYITVACKQLNTFWDSWMDGGGRWWQNIIIGVPVFVCGLSLILARVFIVVEAFVSIRELPAEAYETPRWTQFDLAFHIKTLYTTFYPYSWYPDRIPEQMQIIISNWEGWYYGL